MTRKKILVTGADGFIGSHLTEMLALEGYDVRAFVMYNSFNSWGWLDTISKEQKRNIEIISGDIRDPFGVEKAMRDVDVVLHLAALIAIPFSYESPDAYIQTNVTGTLNILQAAKKMRISRIICTSTSETYGTARFVPITEDHPLNAQSPYAATKVGADQMALAFHRSFDMPITILRPFNTYGPRQSARAVIPSIIGQIAAGSRKIKLGSLAPTRDFTYVSDTAKGFIQAMECDKAIGQVINIGSGFEISIGDTVAAIAEAMKINVEIVQDKERLRPADSEVERLYAGIEKAETLFGWQPKFRGLEGFKMGLSKTAEWFSDPANLSLYKMDRYNI